MGTRERWAARTHTGEALLEAVGGNQTAATIVRFLSLQPEPLRFIATPQEGLSLSNGELNGMSVDDIQWAIASAGMQLGELRMVTETDTIGIARISKMVGVYVTNQKRFGQRGEDRVPQISAALMTALIKHWCAEYKRIFQRDYTVDDADREGAARLFGRGRHDAMAEAEERQEMLSGAALDERAREYVKHWIPFYFKEDAEWIRVDMYRLKHVWKRVSPYGRPPRKRSGPASLAKGKLEGQLPLAAIGSSVALNTQIAAGSRAAAATIIAHKPGDAPMLTRRKPDA